MKFIACIQLLSAYSARGGEVNAAAQLVTETLVENGSAAIGAVNDMEIGQLATTNSPSSPPTSGATTAEPTSGTTTTEGPTGGTTTTGPTSGTTTVVWSIDASEQKAGNLRLGTVLDGNSEEPQPTPAQLCGGAFVQLQFGIFNYDAYNTYFDETSTLTLAQAGVYTGSDAIEEYVKFADENSPYIKAKREYVEETTMTGFDPETNICKFTTYIVNGFDFNPALTDGHTITHGYIINTYYSAATNKVPTVHIYFTLPFTEAAFMQLQTRKVDEFVCDILLGPVCMEELGDQAEQGLTRRKCLNRLSNLPLAEGENLSVDGNSQGCRYLHAVFAQTNPSHCAHVSLIPAKDPKGNSKCQTSAGLSPDEFFTKPEIGGLYDLLGTQTALGLDQDTWVHITKNSRQNSKKSKKSAKK